MNDIDDYINKKNHQLLNGWKTQEEEKLAIINHPEGKRLMEEAMRLDKLAIPREKRIANVSLDFYKMIKDKKFMGFDLEVAV